MKFRKQRMPGKD